MHFLKKKKIQLPAIEAFLNPLSPRGGGPKDPQLGNRSMFLIFANSKIMLYLNGANGLAGFFLPVSHFID